MSRKNKETNLSSIVKTHVSQGKTKHPLQAILDGDPKDFPILKSIGYASMGTGASWVSYVITSRGTEILSIDVSEPNLKQIAEDTAKMEFVEQLMDKEA